MIWCQASVRFFCAADALPSIRLFPSYRYGIDNGDQRYRGNTGR